MRILMFGDVVGEAGCECFCRQAPKLKREYGADLIVVNGENSAKGNGITPQSADMLFSGGADVITTGNHCFRRKCDRIFSNERILRPANYPDGAPGSGVCVLDCGPCSVAVINLMGTAFLDALDNPFTVIDRLLAVNEARITLLDFHAEATSEKRAMGWYLSGRVSAVIGTHTHVQTADEEILDGKTGYLTDVGMVGGERSVLGVKPELAIEKQRFKRPVQFEEAEAPCILNAVFLEIDSKSGICNKIERIFMRGSTNYT
ncbi:MAG: TIGR00282 family metallophosphoesterase [Oscillospiraceae bacterium]|nr:TIGR00282 family metallophosphoesterase [Oscillospiraceae bacterium]